MKLCVYAICKNESKFVDRWVQSLQDEADCVVVLDTGSTDDTVEKLKAYEPFVMVKQFDYKSELGYFRFDKARNDSLKLVPYDADICVVLDLDQVPEKGWSKIIKEAFKDGYKEVEGYIVDHNDSGIELNRWMSRNVHPNSPLWVWDRVIHEGINYIGNEEYRTKFDENFVINHYPDNKKDRSLYKELLQYSCKEYPKDPYYGIYLGIELSRRYSTKDALEAFYRCINECDFTGQEDLKFQCYLNIAIISDDVEEALDAAFEAYDLGMRTRRLYNIMADLYEKSGDYDSAIEWLKRALVEVQSNSNDWKEDAGLFNGEIESRLSLFYYYQKQDYLQAMKYCILALEYPNSDHDNLTSNLKWYYDKFIESRGINNEE